MSVMTPAQLRNGSPVDMRGRPIGPGSITPVQPDLQRQAVVDQLGTTPPPSSPGAGPATPAPAGGAFARGGQVKQLPGSGVGGKVGNIAASAGTNIAATVASRGLDAAANAGNLATGMGIGLGTNYLAGKLRSKEEQPEFGGAFGEYTDDKGRRFQGTGGGVASNAVKFAGYGANPALVGATGGLSVAAGALGGAIKGAITKHAKSAYSDFKVEDAADAIKAMYAKELGREATDAEVQGHLEAQGWDPTGGDRWVGEKGLQNVLGAIRESPEAAQFAGRGAVVDQLGSEPTAAADLAGRRGQDAEVPGSAPAPPLGTGPGGPTAGESGDGAGAGVPPDASGWDTDGYQAPAYVPPQAGAAPPGWDAEKWSNPAHQTPKYGVGRILSNFPPTVEGLKAAMPDIEKAYPGTTFNGKDRITVPGVGEVDVLEAAGLGGKAWRWGADEGGAPAEGPTAATGATLPTETGDNGDLLAQLQAEIDRITKGAGPARGAVMSQLGAGV